MDNLENQVQVYGCSLAKLNQDTKDSVVFNKYGPVVYAGSLMDTATALINEGKTEEAKQAISRAKWVMFTFVMGDDE